MHPPKIHLHVLMNHCAQLKKFSRTNGISSWPKNEKKILIGFQTAQPTKPCAQEFSAFYTKQLAE
jgi:hypothetical protein